MRWRAVLVSLLFLTSAASALAETQVNVCGRYSIWVPDTWKITTNNERVTAESRSNGLYLVAAPIKDKSADLIDEDVTDFIDAELDDMKITSDRRENLGGVAVRIIEGTGKDECRATPLRKVEYRRKLRELSGVGVEVHHENIHMAGASHVERLVAVGGQDDFAALRGECRNHVFFKGRVAAQHHHSNLEGQFHSSWHKLLWPSRVMRGPVLAGVL